MYWIRIVRFDCSINTQYPITRSHSLPAVVFRVEFTLALSTNEKVVVGSLVIIVIIVIIIIIMWWWLSLETTAAVIITCILTVGLSWIFYPAWVVRFADHLEWTVEEWTTMSSSNKDDKGDAIVHTTVTTTTSVVDEEETSMSLQSGKVAMVVSVSPVVLSLVIPAYNEQDRIPVMLQEAFDFINSSQGIQLLQRLQNLQQKETSKKDRRSLRVEWLIVNDGSNDNTCQAVRETWHHLLTITTTKNSTNDDQDNNIKTTQNNKSNTTTTTKTTTTKTTFPLLQHDWKIISLTRNSGKGAAVKTGMKLATGLFHLMVDADGATEFGVGLARLVDEVVKVVEVVEVVSLATKRRCHYPTTTTTTTATDSTSTTAVATETTTTITTTTAVKVVVFGSRAHLQQAATAQRSFLRTLLMTAFHFFVSLLVSSKIHDTQCGFKLFSKDASYAIFATLHLRRWAFDTEIVLLCDHYLTIPIKEVCVPWHEVDGSKLCTSKVALAMVSITMLRDMICVRTCYALGIWNVKTKSV
jgi:dolichyl-phosphate beta-glucosyltransferase